MAATRTKRSKAVHSNGSRRFSGVLSDEGRRWISGDLKSEDYFRIVRARASQRVRSKTR